MEPTPSKRTLKNSLYCNWVKSSTALKYFTDGLRGFVESEFTDFHRSVVNQVGVELKSFNIQPDECGQCSVHNIVPCVPSNGFCRSKKFGKCSVHIDQNKPAKCPKEICSKFFEKIKSNHKKKPSWHNTTAQKWSKDYTEVAKCFLSQNERNRNVKSITDVDTIGLLDMIENYSSTALTRTAQNDILPKCKEVRHKLFHTENFDVKDMEVKDFIKNLITLLSDEKKISDINDVKEAVILLKELGEGKIQVTLEQELEVRKEALSEVQIETEKTRIDKEYIKAQETNLEKVCENLHQYKDDVQLESMSMLTNQQDYMGLQCEYSLQLQSIHKTIKENLAEMSEKSKGDVKQMIDATLEELRQDEVNDSQVDIEQQNEHIKRLEDRVLKLEHSMDSIKETVKELGKKIEGLERLEQLHKHDIEVLSDYIRRKSDTSAQTLENILARELQELLCKRYAKKLSHVSIPFNSEKLLNVMEVHAEQVIQSAKLMGSRSVDVFSNDLGNYANILEKDEKLCKKVVLLGEIGYGKTLYFYRLLQTWVAALKKLKSKGTPLSENEKFLGQFSLIFYIDLESLGNCTYDLEMISRQIFGVPEHVLSKAKPEIYTTILQVLEKEPNECLVIIDSLDKWKQSSGHKNECLPKQQLLEECTTLIGSRQWKWNDISYTTLKDDIDNVFVISGLVNEMSTVKHVINVFCNETTPREDEKTVLEKFNKFSSKSAVNELVKIPVTLHFLIWSMFVCPCTDESLTEIYWRIVVFLFGYTKTWDRPLTVDSIQCSTLGKLNLPESFRSSEVIKQYEVVISKIALLAFKGLLSSDGQSFLVLNVSEIGKYFQKEELEIALKSGILTKERVSGCTPEKTVQLSFLCPTMQYFFAALHLAFSTAQNDKKAFKDLMSFSSIVKNIFKIESFLQFAFCIVPGLCLKFTKGICENLSDDSVTQDLHNSLKYFLMRCLKEVDKYNRPSQNECTFYLESLQLSVNDFASSEVKATLKLYQSNVGNLCQFTAITDVSNSKHDEPIDKISRHIFEHLSTATSLVNLHLTNIVLENGAATALSNLKALQILHLENIANEIRETISMTYCNNIQIVKCSCLKDIELIIGSAALTTVDLWECTSLHLKIEQGSLNYLQVNLSYFKVDELKWLKSIVCKQLRTCVLDFHNVYVHIDELVIERCTDCEVMIDQNRIEEEDLESSTASSLSGYLLDFTKITTKLWTNSSSPCFSSIQKVKVMDCCIRVKIKAFVIVSQCFIYHCMDTDLVFKSNIQDRNAFIELAEQVNESQCLERIEINTLKKDQRKNSIQFLNMPVHLKTVHLSECYDTNIVMDCFDVSVAMATAESYFTQTRSQIDKSYADRNICMVQVKDSELLLKNTSLTFNSVSMKSCQSCTVSFEIKTFEGETNPECVPRTEIVIEELKFAKISSDCLLKGLQTALVRTVRLESCEMARMDIQWRKLTSLYIDNVSELASVIVESLKSSLSLQNLVCRRMPRGTTSDLQNSVASLINLKS